MKNNVCINIKKLREAAHITQEELGFSIGMTRASISAYEHGTVPPLSKLQIIADFFKVPVENLTYGDVNANHDAMTQENAVQYQGHNGDAKEEVKFLREVVRTLLDKLPPVNE